LRQREITVRGKGGKDRIVLSVPKTCATWADALRGAVGAVA
jgi:hypothetical protein